MKRPWLPRIGIRPDTTVQADMTGGTVEVIKLTDNGVPKVLIRLHKNGVLVEMALPGDVALDFEAELLDAITWVCNGGER